jgi:hypothetical protein
MYYPAIAPEQRHVLPLESVISPEGLFCRPGTDSGNENREASPKKLSQRQLANLRHLFGEPAAG